jgi:2-polyprenyl-3-methyl-5-hydroxy-6-metoxy-1,4-benzoquinol methylase
MTEFYKTQVSWIFDTMWYHANQFHGTAPAESVEIALGLKHLEPGNHLDFGAGPGSSSLFFHSLGWNVYLADISTTMLDFARWRLAKHAVPATFFDTNTDPLPAHTFDLITAFDVMVHVPDIQETLEKLHRALKPGGYLVFNIDNLPCTATTQWHLYKDQFPILKHVRRTGFKRHAKITYFHVYEKVERGPLFTKLVPLYDNLRYNRVVTFVGNGVRGLQRAYKNAIR